MKKISVLLFLLCACCIVNAQEYKYAGCLIEQTTPNANGMVWENDSLKFTFSPTDFFWNVKIENKTSEKVVCDWDNTLFIRNKKSSGIVFDNTIRIKKDEPKGTSIIAPGTEISKEIFPLENWDMGVYSVFKKKSIAKEGDMIVRLIFSMYQGEQAKDYEFSFNISVATKK
jgi:hypothetical protein